jgi:hypothetical protein
VGVETLVDATSSVPNAAPNTLSLEETSRRQRPLNEVIRAPGSVLEPSIAIFRWSGKRKSGGICEVWCGLYLENDSSIQPISNSTCLFSFQQTSSAFPNEEMQNLAVYNEVIPAPTSDMKTPSKLASSLHVASCFTSKIAEMTHLYSVCRTFASLVSVEVCCS